LLNNMFSNIPQFVPQKVCLSCDGCCRFKEETSSWRPKVTQEETGALQQAALTDKIFSKEFVDSEGRIKAIRHQEGCHCTFFNTRDNTCGIYSQRPFECQLYPFLLARKGKDIFISVHLNCPFVQENKGKDSFQQFVPVLKKYFDSGEVKSFLRRNSSLVADYSEYDNELEYIFKINVELISKKDLFNEYLKHNQSFLSAFSFAALFGWQDFFNFEFKIIRDHLCVFAESEVGKFLYVPPLGEAFDLKVVEECFLTMQEVNGKSGVSRIENVPEEMLSLFPSERYAFSLKSREYCYHREDIAALKGNRYKSKRSSYNQFIKNNAYEYLPFEAGMQAQCLSLYDQWAKNRALACQDAVYQQMLEENRRVHQLTLQYCQELNLAARVVVVKNKVVAYTAGVELKKDVFCVLFEIADLNFNGLPTFIFSRFCQDEALKSYSFINVMDDFGMDNVKTTKMSFHPVSLVPSYNVKRK